ncbi:MAG: nuclear transport factor 2 family protein [Gelidibacter sp.]|nr:nuclear transport factor 2 family protein [Gelidibacter sp.]
MSPKKIVKAFYESDLANDISLLSKFLHKDCTLHWSSSKGYTVLNFDDLKTFFEDINKAYTALRMQISHLLQDGNFVTTRYTLYVRTIENPDEEVPLVHYISIWEVKDGKLFDCYEISQPVDASTASLKSFSQIKV